MKLPTLNIDVAVNTKTMKKGIAEANKQVQQIGSKGLSLAGGGLGKIGSLTSLGGGFGTGAIAVGGIAAAIIAPFKAAAFVTDSFTESIRRGEDAMKSFAEGKGLTGGLDLGTASRLAAGAEMDKANQMSRGGLWDTFIGSMMNEQGQVGGVAGLVKDWAQAAGEGAKFLASVAGGILGGFDNQEIIDRADQAISRSVGGAQAYMTQSEIDRAARYDEKLLKANREQNT